VSRGERPAEPGAPSELAQQVRLAVPLAAQQLGAQLMGTVDAALLGRYSDTAIAAAGVGNNLLFAISSIGLGIVLGLDSVIPRAVGARHEEDARRYLDAGLRLARLVGVAAALAVLASPIILALTDVDAGVQREVWLYVTVRAVGVVPFLLSIAYRSYLAAHGVTRPLIISVIAGNVVNALLDLILIFGVDAIGLPALGTLGAALATVSVQLVICAIYASAAHGLGGGRRRPRSTSTDLREVLGHGGPVGGQLFAEVGIFGVATVLAAHLGTQSAAAHAIALNLGSFTFSVAVGIGSATSVRVGHAVGAGDLALARRRGMIGLGLGLGVMACFAVGFVAAPRALASAFTGDGAVLAATMPLLQIAALFQLSDGVQAIAAGALRGLGRTRATLVGNVVGHYAIGLPISLGLAFSAALGAPGLWWGLSAGLTATAAYLFARFLAATRPGASLARRPTRTPR
jgi:MATE family multidrug resistance protein